MILRSSSSMIVMHFISYIALPQTHLFVNILYRYPAFRRYIRGWKFENKIWHSFITSQVPTWTLQQHQIFMPLGSNSQRANYCNQKQLRTDRPSRHHLITRNAEYFQIYQNLDTLLTSEVYVRTQWSWLASFAARTSRCVNDHGYWRSFWRVDNVVACSIHLSSVYLDR